MSRRIQPYQFERGLIPRVVADVTINSKQSDYVENAFDRLQQEAIKLFSSCIVKPKAPHAALQCTRGPGAAPSKTRRPIRIG